MSLQTAVLSLQTKTVLVILAHSLLPVSPENIMISPESPFPNSMFVLQSFYFIDKKIEFIDLLLKIEALFY